MELVEKQPSSASDFAPATSLATVSGGRTVKIRALPAHLAVRYIKQARELGIDQLKPEELDEQHVTYCADVVAAGALEPRISMQPNAGEVLATDLSLLHLAELTGAILKLTMLGVEEVDALRAEFPGGGGEQDAEAVGLGSGDGGAVQASEAPQ